MKKENAVLSSKGQLTLPAAVRKAVNFKQGDPLNVYEVGEKYIVIEKAEATPLEEILTRFEEAARKKRLTAEDIADALRAVRSGVYREVYGAGK